MSVIQIKSNITENIRELHSVNCAPYRLESGSNQWFVEKMFGYVKPPRSRLHDACYPWGWDRFVDVPNIFPDFEADVNDPASYNFYFTDEYIASIIKTGTQIVYRLGVSIEWASIKKTSIPPKDNQKWAEICEHIIRHYNEGWAEGFYYGIEYWEIWNEPENPPMWQGTKEQFFELYKTASIHLKKCFPNLKFGGYASCGFYAAFRENCGEFQKSFLTWFDDFLVMVKEYGCPLDFYTWHIYTDSVDEIRASQLYIREHLDAMGFTETESHLNEWNYGAEGGGFEQMDTMVGASFCASAMIAMQDCGIDMGMYYMADGGLRYCGLTNLRTREFTATAHVFAAFNRLFLASDRLETVKKDNAPDILVAGDQNMTCVLLSTYNKNAQDVIVQLDETEIKQVYCYELTENNGFILRNEQLNSAEYRLHCKPNQVFYLVFCGENTDNLMQYFM